MKISKKLEALFIFLSEQEREGSLFSRDDILTATGWKPATFKTYWTKGQLSDFISSVDENIFEASNCLNISLIEFSKLLSQSKHRRALGHNCQSKLAKALLSKSRDNMMLALELYNRPSIENRMDAFVMCFCTAWEQLLKAVIIEKHGESFIFRKNNKKGFKETLSLRECLDKLFPEDSKVKKNIEQITVFRDQAVHLLMPEIQGIASRIFQSGVLNYSSYFEKFTEVSFLSNNSAGMISLVGEFKTPPISVLKSIYGDVANDILELATTLQHEVDEKNDIEYAIPLNVKLVFAKSDDDGNTITLAKAEDGIEGLKKALIIEKPVDRSKTHPYLQKDAIEEINNKLHELYSVEMIDKHLYCTDKKSGKKIINKNCFDSVISKNGWKNSNNKYHHENSNPEYHYYSPALVSEFIKKIMEHENYLYNAKKWYNINRIHKN
ncbi:hypothetical protein ABW11_01420 [Pluralibacter gergoviae]|uniref:DUF3644 domain-containing protein n=1 Tax=Pluralibacter gergoviae TaxID=61647 RepID=UPI0006519A8D|nr:DUF3644 domain-containing protein [Pluralibacter gergoviae]KMK05750.1 hypothetical protein ABW07_19560 [Pluralibacter gergoviae]KMK19178.1 hypothetical protein ABW09_07295 [Pluralibacter gergoviae]KMK25954.1 hypothetical protein ABW10_04400 [Pluralibacter gergoviae]KMK30227.1 hypothetical protein ABW11_01420 [Pluralibacter gergoviae]MBK4117871.1 DUF3644 domain-containing protein [Pluralibacter gergoviae]